MCDYPYLKYSVGDVKTKNNVPVGTWEQDIYISCGKCYTCRNRKLREWIFRMRQESLQHSCSHFVTLTYDPEHLPISKNGFMTLVKKDVQLFIRYLRRKQKQKIRYLAVGEYGTINKRPHYHIILFNVRALEYIYQSWPKGQIHVGTVTTESIAYTLEYLTVYEDPLPEWKDIQPPFKLQSVGLGKNWIDNGGRKWLEENKPIFMRNDGYKMGIPKYYRDKVFDSRIDIGQEWLQEIERVILEQKNLMMERYSDLEIEDIKRKRLKKLKTKKSKKH